MFRRVGAPLILVVAALALANAAGASHRSLAATSFGSNVYVFDPSMTTSQIQATVDTIASEQVDNEFGSRYSLLFRPGTYGRATDPLMIKVGYYTEVAGLGLSPTDVTINGHVDVYNRCIAADNCIALNNFWRSISNLTINVTNAASMTDCRENSEFWAVSQSSPMRRVNINGNLSLMDYCTNGPQWASGGFIADSRTGPSPTVRSNSSWCGTATSVPGRTVSGTRSSPGSRVHPRSRSRTRPTARRASPTPPWPPPRPAARSLTCTWMRPGTTTSSCRAPRRILGHHLGERPNAGADDPAHGFLSGTAVRFRGHHQRPACPGQESAPDPGRLRRRPDDRCQSSRHRRAGHGFATLTSVDGAVPLSIGDVKGVGVAGIMIDAGTVNSPALMTSVPRGPPAHRTAGQ